MWHCRAFNCSLSLSFSDLVCADRDFRRGLVIQFKWKERDRDSFNRIMVVVKSTAKPITFGRVELDFYYRYFYHKAGLVRAISLPAQM